MTGVCPALTVEGVATGGSGVTSIDLGKGLQRGQVGFGDGHAVPVQVVCGAKEALEFSARGGDVVPRDEGCFRFVVEGRLDVLRLQVFGQTFAVLCVHSAQWSDRKKHDCR